MDHSDKNKQNLAIFGLKSLDGISLQELCEAVGKNLPSDVSKKRILNIYIMWLHFRLMVVDISAIDSFTQDIATWYRFLKNLAYDDLLILEVFHDWQRGQASEDPASSRRLSIAAAELQSVMTSPASPCAKEPPSKAAKPEEQFGHMHPDRLKLSQETRTFVDLDDDEGEIVEDSSACLRNDGQSPQEHDRVGCSNLSFLTGSNRLAMGDTASLPVRHKQVKPSHAQDKSMPQSFASRLIDPRGEAAGVSKESQSGWKTKPGFRCDRCGSPGHNPRCCPTNLDPAYDRRPAENYKCHYCRKFGDHYATLCPKHPSPDSIWKQRRNALDSQARLEESQRGRTEDRGEDDRTVRSWDDRRTPFDESSRRGARSRSQIRETGRYHSGGRYQPDYESSSHCVLSSRDHRSKRKASRSPSPDRYVPRTKNHPWDNKHPKETPRKKREFSGDLVAMDQKNFGDGRLSYEDEGYRDMPVLANPSSEFRESQKTPVERPEAPISEKSGNSALLAGDSFELEVLEMILAESVRSDLILLVDSVECLCNPSVATLFRGQENIWVNKEVNTTRPSSSDFFEMQDDDEEEAEATEQMVFGMVDVKDKQTAAKKDVVDSARMLIESVGPVIAEEDAVIADAVPVVVATVASDGVDSKRIATGDVKIHEVLSNEPSSTDAMIGEVGVGAVIAPFDDECPSEPGTHGEGAATRLEEPEALAKIAVLSIQPGPREANDAETAGFSPLHPVDNTMMEAGMHLAANDTPLTTSSKSEPHQPIDGEGPEVQHVDNTVMDLELPVSVVDNPSAATSKTVADHVLATIVDSEMTDVGTSAAAGETAPVPHADNQDAAIVIDSSLPMASSQDDQEAPTADHPQTIDGQGAPSKESSQENIA
ncbi:hypothetical protein VTI74DRAFT_46 [Chaetomium olivicolor]